MPRQALFRTRPATIRMISFGSAHLVGFNMALCDGSVRMVNYTIDLATHSRLCNRRDGLTIDGKMW